MIKLKYHRRLFYYAKKREKSDQKKNIIYPSGELLEDFLFDK
jgi:hypothetical protein